MNVEKLLTDYHIPYATEHKNVRSGWIGVHCPFCVGSLDYHLGYNLDEDYWNCWRCGGHKTKKVIARLLSVNFTRAEEIIKQYSGKTKAKTKSKIKTNTLPFFLPKSDMTLTKAHKRYLNNRGFDCEKLQKEWHIMGTGPVAKLDNLNYANRILAPVFWEGRMVSYQARDITDKHMAKYMACPPEREIISHKDILYGHQSGFEKRGLCVEGITDVWRLGRAAFATFGIKYTWNQAKLISTLFDEVIILYDPERQAQLQAKKLAAQLMLTKTKVHIEKIPVDPGSLSQNDADYLVKTLLTKTL